MQTAGRPTARPRALTSLSRRNSNVVVQGHRFETRRPPATAQRGPPSRTRTLRTALTAPFRPVTQHRLLCSTRFSPARLCTRGTTRLSRRQRPNSTARGGPLRPRRRRVDSPLTSATVSNRHSAAAAAAEGTPPPRLRTRDRRPRFAHCAATPTTCSTPHRCKVITEDRQSSSPAPPLLQFRMAPSRFSAGNLAETSRAQAV